MIMWTAIAITIAVSPQRRGGNRSSQSCSDNRGGCGILGMAGVERQRCGRFLIAARSFTVGWGETPLKPGAIVFDRM